MGQVGREQMETGTFPPPWARGAFSSAGLVAVTQRRESCWGLSPPQGLPGRGPCHTLLLGGLFLARDPAGSSVSPLVTDAAVPSCH